MTVSTVARMFRSGWAMVLVGWVGLSGCSGLATNAIADALSGTGTTFSGDNDPEFVEDAVPFGLKTMEAVLEETPEHQGLLLSLASGYTQYAAAFLAQEADFIDEDEPDEADHLDARARNLYLRARTYGFRALEARHEGFREALKSSPEALRAELSAEDVPYLYWTAAPWALYIASGKLGPESIAELEPVTRLGTWMLELDPDWGEGAVQAFWMQLEFSRPGGSMDQVETYYRRAVELGGGLRAGPHVGLAETVCKQQQDVIRFHELLDRALAIDVDALPESRLENVVMQRRAKWLKSREEELFLIPLEEALEARTSTTVEGQP